MGQVALFLLVFFGIPIFAIVSTMISMRNYETPELDNTTQYGDTVSDEAYYRYDNQKY